MDANRFDALTRVVGRSPDRRDLLKAATGGALGLAGLAALSDGALAKRCQNNRDCNGRDVCDKQKNRCVECTRNKDCRRNQKCNRKNECVNK